MTSEATLQSIKTSTSSIIVNIENLKKVEQDIILIVRIMDILLDRIEIINSSYTNAKVIERKQETLSPNKSKFVSFSGGNNPVISPLNIITTEATPVVSTDI